MRVCVNGLSVDCDLQAAATLSLEKCVQKSFPKEFCAPKVGEEGEEGREKAIQTVRTDATKTVQNKRNKFSVAFHNQFCHN